ENVFSNLILVHRFSPVTSSSSLNFVPFLRFEDFCLTFSGFRLRSFRGCLCDYCPCLASTGFCLGQSDFGLDAARPSTQNHFQSLEPCSRCGLWVNNYVTQPRDDIGQNWNQG